MSKHYVVVCLDDKYGENYIKSVGVFADHASALSEARRLAEMVATFRKAANQWHEDVFALYSTLKPRGWSEYHHRDNPTTFNGKHAESWNAARDQCAYPTSPEMIEVQLFAVEGAVSTEIDLDSGEEVP